MQKGSTLKLHKTNCISFRVQESLHDWEDYESARQQIEEFLKKANNELSRSPANAGQEAVQKELATKWDMHQVLQELQPTLDQMVALTDKLRQKASPHRQEDLQHDLSDLQDKLADTTQQMGAKVELSHRHFITYKDSYRFTAFDS